jgi:1-acyl-sn-glycerol-3-phosphate acyltransferase
MTSPTPFAQRLFRLARLSAHLLHALFIAATGYPGKALEERLKIRRRWSRQLLAILHVGIDERDAPRVLPARCLIASNHISWLDIFVINAVSPATFVSKSDVANWPLVGWLCTRAGTLYIERGSKSGARRANRDIAHALESGALVAICPEGTTTYGDALLSFHAALFQPAVDSAAQVQPVVLRYLDARAGLCRSAGFVGDDSLLDSIWAIVSTRRMTASVRFLPLIDTAGRTRRDIARAAEATIAAALGVAIPARAAEKRDDPQAAPQ